MFMIKKRFVVVENVSIIFFIFVFLSVFYIFVIDVVVYFVVFLYLKCIINLLFIVCLLFDCIMNWFSFKIICYGFYDWFNVL